jgi:hypothetical protein
MLNGVMLNDIMLTVIVLSVVVRLYFKFLNNILKILNLYLFFLSLQWLLSC